MEVSAEQLFTHGLSGYFAYTWLQADYGRFADANGLSLAGNRLPGIPPPRLFAELAWQPEGSGFGTAVEAQGMSKRYATDDNQLMSRGSAPFHRPAPSNVMDRSTSPQAT